MAGSQLLLGNICLINEPSFSTAQEKKEFRGLAK
jgi:hypothetical protein